MNMASTVSHTVVWSPLLPLLTLVFHSFRRSYIYVAQCANVPITANLLSYLEAIGSLTLDGQPLIGAVTMQAASDHLLTAADWAQLSYAHITIIHAWSLTAHQRRVDRGWVTGFRTLSSESASDLKGIHVPTGVGVGRRTAASAAYDRDQVCCLHARSFSALLTDTQYARATSTAECVPWRT